MNNVPARAMQVVTGKLSRSGKLTSRRWSFLTVRVIVEEALEDTYCLLVDLNPTYIISLAPRPILCGMNVDMASDRGRKSGFHQFLQLGPFHGAKIIQTAVVIRKLTALLLPALRINERCQAAS